MGTLGLHALSVHLKVTNITQNITVYRCQKTLWGLELAQKFQTALPDWKWGGGSNLLNKKVTYGHYRNVPEKGICSWSS